MHCYTRLHKLRRRSIIGIVVSTGSVERSFFILRWKTFKFENLSRPLLLERRRTAFHLGAAGTMLLVLCAGTMHIESASAQSLEGYWSTFGASNARQFRAPSGKGTPTNKISWVVNVTGSPGDSWRRRVSECNLGVWTQTRPNSLEAICFRDRKLQDSVVSICRGR
jgi:hypothetical protein